MRIVDLSVALKANIASDPPSMLPTIEYIDHKQGAQEFAQMFPGLKVEDLPGGEGAAIERITLTTHNGTHLDAPWHFSSPQDGQQISDPAPRRRSADRHLVPLTLRTTSRRCGHGSLRFPILFWRLVEAVAWS